MSIEKALNFAVTIIEQYELCIENSMEEIGIDLKKKGFCQGVVFKKALTLIKKKSREEEEEAAAEGKEPVGRLKSTCHGASVIWLRDIEEPDGPDKIRNIPVYKCSECHRECGVEETEKKQ